MSSLLLTPCWLRLNMAKRYGRCITLIDFFVDVNLRYNIVGLVSKVHHGAVLLLLVAFLSGMSMFTDTCGNNSADRGTASTR